MKNRVRQWTAKWMAGAIVATIAVPVFVMAQTMAPNAPERAEAERQAQATAERAAAAAAVAGANGDPAAVWMARGGKKEKAAFLGVVAVAADAAMRDQLKLPRGIGLVIHSVQDETPAAKAGVQEHDIITKLDDQWLVSSQQLGVLVRMHKADDEVTLTGLRQGQPITLKAKLAEKEMVITDNAADPNIGGMNFTIPDLSNLPQWKGQLQPLFLDGDDAALVIREGDQTLKVSVKNNERHLVVTDNNNQVLFDGPVETEDQRKTLPADIAQELDKYKDQFEQVKDTAPGHQHKVRIIKDKDK